MSVLGPATPDLGTDPVLDGTGVAAPNACTNCGAPAGKPCAHDHGCIDTDRTSLASPELFNREAGHGSSGVASEADLPALTSPDEVSLELRVVCAWCLRVLREGDPGALTSHTICESCYGVALGEPPEASVAVRVARSSWERHCSPQLQLGGEPG